MKGYRSFHGIDRSSKEAVDTVVCCSMDWNKKRKSGTTVWHQISTQSSPDKGKNEIDEAEAMVVSPSSTHRNDVLKDANDVLGDSSTTSVAQKTVEVQNAEKIAVSKNKHAVTLEVGAPVMRFIKGKGGSTQKSIEQEMGVKILISKYVPEEKDTSSIVIEGDSMDDITKASQKIQSIINEAAKTSELIYSHFISLPLAIHPEFVDKITKFQSSILNTGRTNDNSGAGTSGDSGKIDQPEKVPVEVDRSKISAVSYAPKATKTTTLFDLRIDGSLFMRPQRLHMTVLMLKCWNKERIDAAMDVLKSINTEVNEVLDNRPLFVRLEGLGLIRGTKPKAQVLYVPVKEVGDEGRLDRACQIISDAYSRAGFVTSADANKPLKFHVTVMNTTFRSGKRKGMKFDSFDARGIFEKFGSEEWGEYHIREAHLSQRFEYDDNGYYHCCASIPLPENIQAHEPPQAELEATPMAESASS